jgi:hypothetical protein
MRPEDGGRYAEHDRAGHHSRKCPFRAELIKREAMECKHCGWDVKPGEEGGGAMASRYRMNAFDEAEEPARPVTLAVLVALGLLGGSGDGAAVLCRRMN